uniref:Uncharacterized protein n=1 Tax=Chromera velia CCMP2878 TaxID=1169474 RepID=A0A0G4I544_9ALVE|eukprot:Cvel_11084.t1-p1 / transcript=Cvel_11084.t1 / gene=Cvel_11084 / organism=Chromera_velia_CCMP2878 / gene_product=hypothetical protein / transcript_product=hypothetical protein / location=Cvel_scaffold685:54864-65342(-) / protein_length=200 / sequence_SO=supercontig / SO=protein_coding / is_pseudo=false
MREAGEAQEGEKKKSNAKSLAPIDFMQSSKTETGIPAELSVSRVVGTELSEGFLKILRQKDKEMREAEEAQEGEEKKSDAKSLAPINFIQSSETETGIPAELSVSRVVGTELSEGFLKILRQEDKEMREAREAQEGEEKKSDAKSLAPMNFIQSSETETGIPANLLGTVRVLSGYCQGSVRGGVRVLSGYYQGGVREVLG